MKTVTNKTNAPIQVPLPRNKLLRLGPGRSGQVSDAGAETPTLVKMIEAGLIQVSDAGGATDRASGRGGAFGRAGRFGGGRSIGRRGGDR